MKTTDSNDSKHTPTPWTIKEEESMKVAGLEVSVHSIDTQFGPVARVIGSAPNAALIVRAVNLHEEMKEALQKCKDAFGIRTLVLEPDEIEAFVAAAEALKKATP